MIIMPALLVNAIEDAKKTCDLFRGTAPWLHVDYADGTMTETATEDLAHFIGMVDGYSTEVHLMTTQPEEYVDACEALGAARVYFHLGEVESPQAVVDEFAQYDFATGIVLSPQTDVAELMPYLSDIDAVQIMTVTPGRMGNAFLANCLEKVETLKSLKPHLWVSVDGGVSQDTVSEIHDSGADAAAVGSALEDPMTAQTVFAELNEKG